MADVGGLRLENADALGYRSIRKTSDSRLTTTFLNRLPMTERRLMQFSIV